jgi:transcriptional regulator with XRE-family HTH domain
VAGGVDARMTHGRIGLGNRVRDVRQGTGVGLAAASERAGISYSYLSDIERGRRLPTLEVLDSIAVALDTSVSDLLRDVYPWDASEPPRESTPPRDGRERPAGD